MLHRNKRKLSCSLSLQHVIYLCVWEVRRGKREREGVREGGSKRGRELEREERERGRGKRGRELEREGVREGGS